MSLIYVTCFKCLDWKQLEIFCLLHYIYSQSILNLLENQKGIDSKITKYIPLWLTQPRYIRDLNDNAK